MRSKGFTLIELLVVLVIVGLLAALAYPNYQAHLQRSRRTEAQLALMRARQFMERHHAAHNSYAGAELPGHLRSTPGYLLSVDDQEQSYTLKAEPQLLDPCGELTLTHTGVKGIGTGTGNDAGGPTVQQCWR